MSRRRYRSKRRKAHARYHKWLMITTTIPPTDYQPRTGDVVFLTDAFRKGALRHYDSERIEKMGPIGGAFRVVRGVDIEPGYAVIARLNDDRPYPFCDDYFVRREYIRLDVFMTASRKAVMRRWPQSWLRMIRNFWYPAWH